MGTKNKNKTTRHKAYTRIHKTQKHKNTKTQKHKNIKPQATTEK
jgi:hypothetical protein